MAADLVSIIQGTPSVTSDMKIALGVTVRKTRPTRIDAPTVAPFLRVSKIEGRTVTVELRQSTARRGKPAKVAGANVFTHTGPTEPTSMEQWQFAQSVTRTTVELPCSPSATGDTLWVTAFWTNAKGQAGPAGRAAGVNLAAGGPLPAEAGERQGLKIAA